MLTSEAGGTNKKKKKRKHHADGVSIQPHIGEKNSSVGTDEAKKQKEVIDTTPQLPDSGGPAIQLTRGMPAEGPVIDSKDEHAAEKAPEEGKKQPVLPWMRLPVKIEAGQGVPLKDVRGLDVRLQDALKACEPSSTLTVPSMLMHMEAKDAPVLWSFFLHPTHVLFCTQCQERIAQVRAALATALGRGSCQDSGASKLRRRVCGALPSAGGCMAGNSRRAFCSP